MVDYIELMEYVVWLNFYLALFIKKYIVDIWVSNEQEKRRVKQKIEQNDNRKKYGDKKREKNKEQKRLEREMGIIKMQNDKKYKEEYEECAGLSGSSKGVCMC